MTTEHEVSPEKKFVAVFLPWLVATGALTVYLVTLNPWVSLGSLQPVAQGLGLGLAAGIVWPPFFGW